MVTTDAGIVEARVGRAAYVIDKATLLVVAKGETARVTPKTPVGHLLALTVSPSLAQKTRETYGGDIDARRFERTLRTTTLLPRTTWLNELCHRYLFERAHCKKRNNDATRFLETEIPKEVYFVALEREKEGERPSVASDESPLLARALAVIEAKLFDDDVIASLPATCGASESSLLRALKRELGVTPSAYVRGRRLDEARLLLLGRRFAIGEIATKVGYKSFAAFSEAFRARFGVPPSQARRARDLTTT